MIRFIDLRHHEEDLAGDRFAFFNTVTGQFLSDDVGTQTWGTLQDFETDISCGPDAEYKDRCVALVPEWLKETHNGSPLDIALADLPAHINRLEDLIARDDTLLELEDSLGATSFGTRPLDISLALEGWGEAELGALSALMDARRTGVYTQLTAAALRDCNAHLRVFRAKLRSAGEGSS